MSDWIPIGSLMGSFKLAKRRCDWKPPIQESNEDGMWLNGVNYGDGKLDNWYIVIMGIYRYMFYMFCSQWTWILEIYREIDMILDIADRKTLYRNTVVKPMEHDLQTVASPYLCWFTGVYVKWDIGYGYTIVIWIFLGFHDASPFLKMSKWFFTIWDGI